jgi:hypothetical protein
MISEPVALQHWFGKVEKPGRVLEGSLGHIGL